jgi:hypothetical protein
MMRLMDCRAMEKSAFVEFARSNMEYRDTDGAPGRADSLFMTAWQAAALPADLLGQLGARAAVGVPDFLNYARLLNTGQAGALMQLAGGPMAAGVAGLAATPAVLAHPLRTAQQDFWVVAEALLRFDMALVPRAFRGTALLHSYLADFAFVFNRRDLVARYFQLASPRLGPGLHTQQLPTALACLARWGLVPQTLAFLCSPRDADGAAALATAQESSLFQGTVFVADISSQPPDVQSQPQLPAGIACCMVSPP